MTYNEFKAKWLGKGINYDNFAGAQCTDVYRMYVKEVLQFPQSPSVTGAKNIWDTYLSEYFDRIPNTPDGVPEQGCVAIWGHGTYGHVGIVDSADKQYLTCFEQNWVEMDGSGVSELRKHTYANVLGWLKPKAPVSTTYKSYDLSNTDSMKIAVDVLVDLQSGSLVRKSDVDKIISDSNQKLVDAATQYEKEKAIKDEQIKALEESLQKLQDTEHTWADQADIYQRKLKAIVEEFAKVDVQIAVETDEDSLLAPISLYLSSITKLQSDLLDTQTKLSNALKTVDDLSRVIVTLKKQDKAFKTVNLPGLVIKIYKK